MLWDGIAAWRKMNCQERPFLIVGAGIAGLTAGHLLAKAGHSVLILERRSRPEVVVQSRGRSINFTITRRGLQTLEKLGISDRVMRHAQNLSAREIHLSHDHSKIQPYGPTADDQIHSICRTNLLQELLALAESTPGLEVRYEMQVAAIDVERACATLQMGDEKQELLGRAIIGADGTNSRVRKELIRCLPATFQQETFAWPYVEVGLGQSAVQRLELDLAHLHVIQGADTLFIGIPNRDQTITGMLLIRKPLKDQILLQSLLKAQMPRLLEAQPDFAEQASCGRLSYLPSIQLSHWYLRDRVALIGDACHTVYPFYGQGMNCALEDALILTSLIQENPNNLETAFAQFQLRRKPETDALRSLSVEHFFSLHKRGFWNWSLEASTVHKFLTHCLGGLWPHTYQLVAAGDRTLAQAFRIIRRQKAIIKYSGLSLVDLFINWRFEK